MLKTRWILPLFVGISLGLAGCPATKDSEEAYTAPVAIAGDSQDINLGETVTMDGSASTVCCELELAYQWTFKQIPIDSAVDDAVFGSTNGSTAAQTVNWVPDTLGAYVVGLVVTDNVSVSNEALIVINVYANNLPPIANAGPDQTGGENVRVLFDGSASNDPEGAALDYIWTLASAPATSTLTSANIFDADTNAPSIVPDASGPYVLSLVVSDGDAFSDPDYATANIASSDLPPVAEAGSSETLSPCAPDVIHLNGFGSYDPEGESLAYAWSVMSVPEGSTATDEQLSDPTVPDPTFAYDIIPGSYTFSLQVNDGENASAFDEVTITLVDASENGAPSANAGDNQTIELEADCTSSDYSWTCEQCVATSFTLDGSASSDPDGDSLSYMWTNAATSGTIETAEMVVTQFHAPSITATYGSTTVTAYDLTLEVTDCGYTDSDTVKLTVTCEGIKP